MPYRNDEPKPKHPSGQPQGKSYRFSSGGTESRPNPPRTGFLIDRLNHRELAGGFGFPLRAPRDDRDDE